jgi:hypothetical protein
VNERRIRPFFTSRTRRDEDSLLMGNKTNRWSIRSWRLLCDEVSAELGDASAIPAVAGASMIAGMDCRRVLLFMAEPGTV